MLLFGGESNSAPGLSTNISDRPGAPTLWLSRSCKNEVSMHNNYCNSPNLPPVWCMPETNATVTVPLMVTNPALEQTPLAQHGQQLVSPVSRSPSLVGAWSVRPTSISGASSVRKPCGFSADSATGPSTARARTELTSVLTEEPASLHPWRHRAPTPGRSMGPSPHASGAEPQLLGRRDVSSVRNGHEGIMRES